MCKKIKKVVFNGIEYNILNEIIFDNIHYLLVFNEVKYKILYKNDNEYFQLIKNKNYKEIINLLYSGINE